jgi:hypothetical protein
MSRGSWERRIEAHGGKTRHLAAMALRYGENRYDRLTHDVEIVTGMKPMTIREWVRLHARTFKEEDSQKEPEPMIDAAVILKRFEEPDEVRTFDKGRFEIVRIGAGPAPPTSQGGNGLSTSDGRSARLIATLSTSAWSFRDTRRRRCKKASFMI